MVRRKKRVNGGWENLCGRYVTPKENSIGGGTTGRASVCRARGSEPAQYPIRFAAAGFFFCTRAVQNVGIGGCDAVAS